MKMRKPDGLTHRNAGFSKQEYLNSPLKKNRL